MLYLIRGGITMKNKEKLLQEVTLLKMNEIKPNYSELARMHECDRRTVEKYFNGYFEKSNHRKKVSKLDQYENEIKEKLKIPGITISALYRFLSKKYGDIGSYTNLRAFILSKNLMPIKDNKAHLRFETEYGKQLQFDWKEDLEMYNKNGEIFKFNIFSATLCASRFHVFLYSKYKTRFDVERCLIETFKILGGLPKEVLTDNMSSIVDTNKHKFTKEFVQFIKDIGVQANKCKVRHPYTKGKVESSNRFVNWLKPYNGEFETEEDIIEIVKTIMKEANIKTNETTGVPPTMLYQKEREYLNPLPNDKIMNQYLTDNITVKVTNESLFYYKGKRYSVSPEYINKNINVIEYNNRLYVYYSKELITMHDISEKKINYKEEHYIEGLRSLLQGKEQEKIEEQAKKSLELLEKI
jgi:transposase